MKLHKIKSANEYLGKEVVKKLYMKDAPENARKYLGIPLPKNGVFTTVRKKK